MVNSQILKALVPEYMMKFACIGSDCVDSCCTGWHVTVDQASYKKYKKVNDPDLQKMFKEHLKRERSNENPGIYAYICLRDDYSCPFLDTDRLCVIQKGLGEDYLSITCDTYPRTFNTVDGVLEISGSVSCPEIARSALLNPEGIKFCESEVEKRKIAPGYFIDTLASSQEHLGHFWDVRSFVLQLLKSRDYALWERLVILGLFLQNVRQCFLDGKVHDIPGLIEKYTGMIINGSFKDMLKAIPSQNTIQMELIKELVGERFSHSHLNQRYQCCVADCLAGISYTAEASKEEVGLRYREAFINFYEPFMRDREYLLENYLVNYVFRTLFPLGGHDDLFDNYLLLVINYAMIQMQLIGMAGFYREEFCEEHVLTLIQSFAKDVENNPSFLKHIMQLMKDNGFATAAYMAILVKS